MTKKKLSFWGGVKSALSSQYFKDAATTALIKVLKLQAFGGVRGWLIKTLAKEFTEDVVEIITDTIDYIKIKHKVRETINEEDRNNATDLLNDLMR